MYRRFGAEVTVVEKGPRLIGREDADVSDAVQEILEKRRHRGAAQRRMHRLRAARATTSPSASTAAGEPEVRSARMCCSRSGGGPTPTTSASTRPASRPTRAATSPSTTSCAPTCRGIWALGDCNGRGAFTHTAYNDFEIVAANLLDGDPRRVSDRIPAYALYIDPPLGRAGMTEAEARKSGRPALVGTRPMTRVGRAVEKGETQGFMKVVVDADNQGDPGRGDPRRRRRRGDPRHPRHDVRQGARTRRCSAPCTSTRRSRS